MAVQVRDKPYYLASVSDASLRITVRPVWLSLPGPKSDVRNHMDSQGRWVRVFEVEDSNGIDLFENAVTLSLKNAPRETPYYIDPTGSRWELQHIPGVRAKNHDRSIMKPKQLYTIS